MKWFRFYHEAVRDPKVQKLRPELFKFWVNLLCVASESTPRGTLESIDHIAFAMRTRADRITRFMDELQACHLVITLPKGGFQPVNWSVRQPQSDNVAKRVNDHRKRASVKQANPDVTLRPGCSNVTVTAQELDLEEEKENAAAALACAREQAAASLVPIGSGESAPPVAESGPPGPGRPAVDPHLREAIVIVRRLAGEDAARQIWACRARLAQDLGGRWDCYASAMRQIEREAAEPNAEPIRNLYALSRRIALRHVETGIPIAVAPRPGSVPGATSYRRPREREVVQPPLHQVSPERRAELAEGLRKQKEAAAARREAGDQGRPERGRNAVRVLSRESLAMIGRDGTVIEPRTGT